MFRARRKELLASSGQDDHVDVVVETRAQDRVVQLAHHIVGIGVGGGVVQGDQGDAVRGGGVANKGLFGHRDRSCGGSEEWSKDNTGLKEFPPAR